MIYSSSQYAQTVIIFHIRNHLFLNQVLTHIFYETWALFAFDII